VPVPVPVPVPLPVHVHVHACACACASVPIPVHASARICVNLHFLVRWEDLARHPACYICSSHLEAGAIFAVADPARTPSARLTPTEGDIRQPQGLHPHYPDSTSPPARLILPLVACHL